MRKQGYRVKAGIEAVTGLSLFPHSSKRVDFSKNSPITMIFSWQSLRKSPLLKSKKIKIPINSVGAACGERGAGAGGAPTGEASGAGIDGPAGGRSDNR